MDRPIVDGRWRVHINGEGGMMVSVDLIAMVTSEASYGYERSELWSRAKRVTVVFNDTPMEEVSGVFFLTLLTSSSLCPHSYGGRFWSVLPHCSLRYPCDLTHSYGGRFWSVLPHCSLRHPCDLTPITCATTLSELTISLTSLSL